MKVIGLFCCLAALATLSSGLTLDCDYFPEFWPEGNIGLVYTCGAFVTSMENPTIVTEITGAHMEGFSDADVKGFWIMNHGMLTTIPSGIENFFPNLHAFDWRWGSVATIDSDTFSGFPNLSLIDLGSNKLVSLDADLFQHTRQLQWISFSFNFLQHVGHDLMTEMTNLEAVFFNSNPCINAQARLQPAIQELNRRLPIECPPLSGDPPSTVTSYPSTLPDTPATDPPPTTTYEPSTTTPDPTSPDPPATDPPATDPPATDPPAPDPPVATPVPTTTNSSSGLHAHKLLLVWSISILMLTMFIRAK